jgi:CheY-like chemotaxis protein
MGAEPRDEPRRAWRVLVVDDEPTIRELVAAALVEVGYQVSTAANGAQALQHMEADRPDAIVLDLMMPVMDATGLLQLMRLNPRLNDVPVLVISAGYGALDEARRLGARACLTKPFQLEDLLGTLEHLIGSPADLSGRNALRQQQVLCQPAQERAETLRS